ncbi:MAG TPA: class I SAM-dependent methyltransferase [Caldimonas sp.]|nr:class I SAM-dependent methyltransferase [Caldimonas sp.]
MSEASLARIHASVEAYYSATVEAFGATPRGVDWTCAATQQLRFVQLLRHCDKTSPASINDLGCGYGALLAFCRERWPAWPVDYLGIDLSDAMIRAARSRWPEQAGVRFVHGTGCPRVADHSIASGIFNVCGAIERADWEDFIRATLRELKASSRRGFAVNLMAELAPGATGPRELYRTSPTPWVAFCEDQLGLRAVVLRDYGLREFTLWVACDNAEARPFEQGGERRRSGLLD